MTDKGQQEDTPFKRWWWYENTHHAYTNTQAAAEATWNYQQAIIDVLAARLNDKRGLSMSGHSDRRHFIVIEAPGAPWGSTINVDKLDNIRLQPKVDENGQLTGEVSVLIRTDCGDQVLTYPNLADAQKTYFRLQNELLGKVQ